MRRFFRLQRDEDYSQIQYLTAKCSRLAQEKAALERECVLSREKVRVLQAELETVCLQLRRKENTIEELVGKLQRQQSVVSAGDAALLSVHLESISSELQCLQSTEKQLMAFINELRREAQHSTRKAESLEVQLHREAQLHARRTEYLQEELERKTHDMQELQKAHDALQQDLCEQNSAYQRTVLEPQCENTSSVEKLKEMAEQVEWLCEQQRNWKCCIKRFKECLNDEKETLVLQVDRLQEELLDLKSKTESQSMSKDDTQAETRCSRWDVDAMLDLQVEADMWKERYQELIIQLTSHKLDCHEDGYLKPP